jgi:hypothetical protein
MSEVTICDFCEKKIDARTPNNWYEVRYHGWFPELGRPIMTEKEQHFCSTRCLTTWADGVYAGEQR